MLKYATNLVNLRLIVIAEMTKKSKNFFASLAAPRNRRRAMWIFWSIFSFPFLFIGTLIILVVCGAFGSLPSFEELENPNNNLTTEVVSSNGVVLGTYQSKSFLPSYYDELSPYLIQALIATEDARFVSHSGVDFIGLGRVGFKTMLMFDRGQGGGSTISQQLAKNLYPRDTTSRSSVGKIINLGITKIKEWVTATMLEYNYTKEEIITMYFNRMEYGSNAHGIKTAARTFFDKTPAELTVPEAAVLVGVVNAPTRYSPVQNPAASIQRRNTVIERMATQGFITEQEAKEYINQPLNIKFTLQTHNQGPAPYFREMLRRYMIAKEPQRNWFTNDWNYKAAIKQWENDPLYGWCTKNKKPDGTSYNLETDGLRIFTTIDSRMQQYAEEAVQEHLGEKGGLQDQFDAQKKEWRGEIFYNITKKEKERIVENAIKYSHRAGAMRAEGASDSQIKLAFEKPVKMKIFTYKGERDTVMSPKDSIMHYKALLRASFVAVDPVHGYLKAYVGGPSFKYLKYDMANQGKRQVGSTVKPFLYTFAFDNLGFDPCTMVPNLPVSISTSSGDAFNPKEAGNVEYDGELHSLRWGLANSRNNYSAWIMKQSSPEAVADLIHKMGVTTWIDPVYAICTGSPEVTLYEMVGAFATFVNEGMHKKPIFVTRIEDSYGNTLATFSPTSQEAISKHTANTMLSMLQSNITQGTGARLRYQYQFMGEIGGKTGTTNNNSDGWFIGVTPRLAAGAWVGAEERSTHLKKAADGSRVALPIFGKFMTKVYNDPTLGYSKDDRFRAPVGSIRVNCDTEVKKTVKTDEDMDVDIVEDDIDTDDFF